MSGIRMALVPRTPAADKAIIDVFAKLDRGALGIAVGSLCGLVVFLATLILVVKGGHVVGPNLALLGQFFLGYKVTFTGAFVGLVYGFLAGFAVGWSVSFLRNSLMHGYLLYLRTRANLTSSLDSID
jgi:hypothetical protein